MQPFNLRFLLSFSLAVLLLAGCSEDADDSADTTLAPTTTTTTLESGGVPVAPDEAQIEMTYTDDGVSYFGDRVIVEGTVAITFTNETDAPATWSVWGYETGSEALAEELAFLAEGSKAVPINPLPVAGYFAIDYEWPDDVGEPGSQVWKVHLVPGTWIFDVGPESFRSTGLWRAAVIEVVAE